MAFLISGLSSALTLWLVGWLSQKNYFDRPELTLIDEGEYVRVRTSDYARYIRTAGRRVKKSDIVKIQKAGCISLFNRSDNAMDIWVHPSAKDTVFAQAIGLFPGAEVVLI